MNLTAAQRELLEWLIAENERGQHKEVIDLSWPAYGSYFNVANSGRETPMFARKALLQGLEEQGLVTLLPDPIPIFEGMQCVLKPAAFATLSPTTKGGDGEVNVGRLTSILSSNLFTMDELEDAVFRLGINDGSLQKSSKTVYVRELVRYAQQRDMLWQLVRTVLSLE